MRKLISAAEVINNRVGDVVNFPSVATPLSALYGYAKVPDQQPSGVPTPLPTRPKGLNRSRACCSVFISTKIRL